MVNVFTMYNFFVFVKESVCLDVCICMGEWVAAIVVLLSQNIILSFLFSKKVSA